MYSTAMRMANSRFQLSQSCIILVKYILSVWSLPREGGRGRPQ